MDKDTQWVFAFSSTIGNGHIAEKLPCQDSCSVYTNDYFNIAVVADGAGSCVNSNLGSTQVTNSCCFHFPQLIKNRKWSSNNIPTFETWQKEATATLLRVKDDLVNFSINGAYDYKSLSCTVIVVISFDNTLLIAHIGDGRAGYCDSNLDWQPMMVPYHGEEANQTVFITSDIWDNANSLNSFIECRVVTGEIIAFCLMSDGCEKSAFECNLFDPEREQYYDPNQPYPQFFNTNIRILQEFKKEKRAQDEINMLWASFLTSGTDKLRTETDDKTLILGVKCQ